MNKNITFRNKKDCISVQLEMRSLKVIFLLSFLVILSAVVGTGLGNTTVSPLEVMKKSSICVKTLILVQVETRLM